MLLLLFRLDYSRAASDTELDFQESLKKAVKAATHQVTDRSRAEGDPRIHSNNAHEAFTSMLADNLKLNPDSLTPLDGSPLAEAPIYSLIIYNGDGKYESTGAQAVYQYDFDGSNLSSYPLSGVGFPQQFTVSDFGISYGTGGTFDITMETPGCIAVMKIKLKTITTDISPVRWAAAKVHYKT
ncbi:hypothetical protein [Desulfofalx alkaliphila]|uniref:hypothetical protein n=1 Tax=Desulfofalx alkaliphila TaxID=105483 RepID=UPI001A9A3FDD|nr:hypothetical protein [Desulfofalx alkaliphila]